MRLGLILTSALALASCGEPGIREQIRAVGSSTVYPFTTAVAERFVSKNPQFKSPIVESTGTGAGMSLFCTGVGSGHPDVANASRRIKASELAECASNGVDEVVEVQVGIDGLAFAQAKGSQPLTLTTEELYRALAATPYGKPQTAKTWADINPALPAVAIQVYGPPSTSGTRDSLNELILTAGCNQNPEMKALKESDEDKHKAVCTKVREDGAYVDSGENDNLIVQKLGANPDAVGIFGYSFLEENQATLNGIPLNGVAPSYETISSFDYPGARPLYIYVKKAHVRAIPGLREFLAEYAGAWNPGGYLVERGMLPAPDGVRAQAARNATELRTLQASDLE